MAKVRVELGGVAVSLSGVDLSVGQVRGLVRLLAGVAVLVAKEGISEGSEEAGVVSAPIGFSVYTERASEAAEDMSEWFEDEE